MLSFIDVIPSKENISQNESLNLLGGVANDAGALTVDISVWGRSGTDWQTLATQKTVLLPGEHKHLYFTLEPTAFSEACWGEKIEELELIISDSKPGPGETGKMIFID